MQAPANCLQRRRDNDFHRQTRRKDALTSAGCENRKLKIENREMEKRLQVQPKLMRTGHRLSHEA